eukprot:CAMPEP_0174728942 /NCGR_PEP_ID=MMETSP1094-20130205/52719_1 /TAXON_ID=156173 /ORGANISM="Chrysochromulina brevifilum, Strain UTEX LB 985" /LENGTH=84 /DNA_ID=CAMNT_0015930965 /DNA_START=307 /DNA_END=561 /DNA_ORIENTATION=-
MIHKHVVEDVCCYPGASMLQPKAQQLDQPLDGVFATKPALKRGKLELCVALAYRPHPTDAHGAALPWQPLVRLLLHRVLSLEDT